MITSLKIYTYNKAKTIYSYLNKIIGTWGFKLIKVERKAQIDEFVFNLLATIQDDSNEISSIVFSKDRAMQLHAFLSSYEDNVMNRGIVYILYRCSDLKHKSSYNELIQIFKSEKFVFVEETDFRKQLIEICESIGTGKVIFYVDDMIFTHPLDYNEIRKINTYESILALSRGKDMKYSMVLEKELTLPQFTPIFDTLFHFNWNYSAEYSDWTFPLGLSGYMYGTKELIAMLKSIPFKAPNTLEWSMQVFLPFFINRGGLCPEFATSVCIHANLVQSEGESPVLGTFSIEALLELWENGKKIVVSDFYNLPINITETKKYLFENR